MKTLVIQSYRSENVPGWIDRCLRSVRDWTLAQGSDYQLVGDESFQLCGDDYLARVGGNVRSITNLARLILVKQAHEAGYDRAIWIDADIVVFAPEQFRIDLDHRYAFARETWFAKVADTRWRAFTGANNSVFVCMAGEPDLDFLISATRHIATHRQIGSNYQVGGDMIKGLRDSLGYQVLDNVGMFSGDVVEALARKDGQALRFQARFHGTPVYAANLCAGGHYKKRVTEADALSAIETLVLTGGEVVNAWLSEGALRAQPYPGNTILTLAQDGLA